MFLLCIVIISAAEKARSKGKNTPEKHLATRSNTKKAKDGMVQNIYD
jgi:hypothetical protein